MPKVIANIIIPILLITIIILLYTLKNNLDYINVILRYNDADYVKTIYYDVVHPNPDATPNQFEKSIKTCYLNGINKIYPNECKVILDVGKKINFNHAKYPDNK